MCHNTYLQPQDPHGTTVTSTDRKYRLAVITKQLAAATESSPNVPTDGTSPQTSGRDTVFKSNPIQPFIS